MRIWKLGLLTLPTARMLGKMIGGPVVQSSLSSEDSDDWTTGHPIIFPNILAVGSVSNPSFQIRIPVDDTHTRHYRLITSPRKDGVPRWSGLPVDPIQLF